MAKFLNTILWLATGAVVLVVATEPVSIQAQFCLGVSAIVLMLIVRKISPRGHFGRHVFLALGTLVVMRYVYWRTTNTLPPVDDLLDFIPGIILWAAEMFSVLMLAISLFVVADPLERKPARRLSPKELPTVDVYIPTYNEDIGLLGLTLAAATKIDYPADKLKVYLLDDGGTDQKCRQENPKSAYAAKVRRRDLTALAADMGATYITRAKNEHAKAGNMNNALGRTTGELVAVFDADHVPMTDFLAETVGFFRDDPRLFLVQTPHNFSNPDPLEKNLRTFEKMPSENEMFYGIIQKGLDKWNGAFFCGSAALLRRKALQEVGGFSGISITEDCETALDLHSRGWNSLYIDKPMISGLQPESFASFIGQRSRWARGMFQIFLLKNPLFKRGLSMAQKICYLSNMMYWFFSFPRLSFFFAPLLYIFFSMHIYQANAHEFVAYTIIYMIANMLMQNRLYGTVRWPWVSELYEYVQSIFLVRGLLSVVLNPWKPTFNVTDKGQSLEREHLSELAFPYIIMFALVLASTAVVGWRMYTDPDSRDLLAVVAVWNTFNLILAGISLGVVSERRTPRIDISRYAELALGTAIVPVHVTDASYAGCRVVVEEEAIGQQMRPGGIGILSVCTSGEDGRIETLPVVLSNRTRTDAGWALGFSFGTLRANQYRVLADLLYTDSGTLEAQRLKRRKQKGVIGGVMGFGKWAGSEPVRGLRQFAEQYRPAPAAPVAAAAGVENDWLLEAGPEALPERVLATVASASGDEALARLPAVAMQH